MSTPRAETVNDEKLVEEQEFLLRSLDDLEDEYANGDLSDNCLLYTSDAADE